jgi:hypothetical protein
MAVYRKVYFLAAKGYFYDDAGYQYDQIRDKKHPYFIQYIFYPYIHGAK